MVMRARHGGGGGDGPRGERSVRGEGSQRSATGRGTRPRDFRLRADLAAGLAAGPSVGLGPR